MCYISTAWIICDYFSVCISVELQFRFGVVIIWNNKFAMSDFRVVELTRTNEKGGKGTFGFSVSGGAGTKLPVVVWEVTPGLPADLSKEV